MGKFKYKIAAVLALGLMFFNVACSKKSSNNDNNGAIYNPTYPGGGLIGNCQNCNFAQAQLFNISTQSSGLQINWQVLGDQNVINQIASYGWNPMKTYQGAAAVVGNMVVSQSLYVGQCVIPNGDYQISTVQVGSAQSGPIFNIPQVRMTSPNGVQLVAQIYNAIPIFDGSTGQIRNFFGYVIVQQGPVYQYGYGYPGGTTGGMGNCGSNGYFTFGSNY